MASCYHNALAEAGGRQHVEATEADPALAVHHLAQWDSAADAKASVEQLPGGSALAAVVPSLWKEARNYVEQQQETTSGQQHPARHSMGAAFSCTRKPNAQSDKLQEHFVTNDTVAVSTNLDSLSRSLVPMGF